MVANIADAMAKVKEDLPRMIEKHVAAYLAAHPQWVWRKRLLDPLTTTQIFALQVLHANTAITHLRHLSDVDFTAAAYCNARARLPLELLQAVSEGITRDVLPESDDACRWRGHRVWLADATSFCTPDTHELTAQYGKPTGQAPGCGFPTSTTLSLCNTAGFIARIWDMPLATHDASQMARLHQHLEPGDVLVYDRAACSYAHLAMISRHKVHAIFRMHQKQIVNFRVGRKHAAKCPRAARRGQPKSQWLQRLGKHDQRVRWFKPSQKPKWMIQKQFDALPESLELRELRYVIRRRGFRTRMVTLVTTLLDPQTYPAAELAQQYLNRWDIEVNFRHLKCTLKMDMLKCKTVVGVRKELAVFVMVYNLVRLVMLRAAQRQKVPPDRISFVDALRWLCNARDAGDVMNLITNPNRPGRIEPRVIKRRMKEYNLMNKPRNELRKTLIKCRVTA